MKIIQILVSIILHCIAISLIFFAFYPIATWYFTHRPILGVDFYNAVSFTRFFYDNGDFLQRDFLHFWYAGSAVYDYAVMMWFRVFSLVAQILPLLNAVKVAALGSFVLLLLFTYLACYRLSRNHLLSALLSVLVAYSANMYGSMTWGGSLPYFANQMFFPAMIWLVASYIETGNRRWYWLMIFVLGLAFLGHLANTGAFTIPALVLPLLFSVRKNKISISSRVKEIFVVLIGGYVFAYQVTTGYLTGVLKQIISGKILNPYGLSAPSAQVQVGTSGISVSGDQALVAFERSRVNILFTDTHLWIFVFLGIALLVALIALLAGKQKKQAFTAFGFVLLAGYSCLHVVSNSYGIAILPQAWYRAFWHFPIAAVVAIAALFGFAQKNFSSRINIVGNIFFILLLVGSGIGLGYQFVNNTVLKTISIVDVRSSPGSAHPEAINLVTDQADLERIKQTIIPVWLSATEKNYRLYTSDAQVNVWWNALFDIPLARGYLDPPGNLGYHFLLDQAIAGNGLVENFKYSESASRNMALFFIDWYAVKYAEGGHLSKSPNKAVSSYLHDQVAEEAQTETLGAYILYETISGKPEVKEDVPQYLQFYRFSDEIVTPILSETNAPAILCICDDAAYEGLSKVLGLNNINSQYLITAFSNDWIDTFSLDDYKQFDAVLLANYRYKNKNKAFGILTKYVEQGGNVFIDTGGEVKESESVLLPDLFPFTQTVREGLGKEWNFTDIDESIMVNTDTAEFAPPIYNADAWKLSHPVGELKADALVLLSHDDKPLIISSRFGQGTLIWSGMNLAYHVHSYTNTPESILYVNLLRSLVPIDKAELIQTQPTYIKSRQAQIKSSGGRGVLFKTQFYNGWRTTFNGFGTKTYHAGPSFPGFMYVPTRHKIGEVHFAFWGEPVMYLKSFIPIVMTLLLLDLIFFNGRLIAVWCFKIAQLLQKQLGFWWKKEEE